MYMREVKKMSKKIMFIRITTNCNAKCFMCKYAKNYYSYSIDEKKLDFILEYMKKDGNYEMVRFTGGEPLLHPKINEMIKKFSSEGFKTSIITNGYLMPQKYDELIKNGLSQVIFSLDGSIPQIHDKARNIDGLFLKVMESIKLLREAKTQINIRINTIASKYNIDDLINIFNLLKNYRVDMWSIIPLKSSSILWNDGKVEYYLKKYKEFVEYVKNVENPILLGYSKNWGGRNEEEVKELFYNNKLFRPNTKCNTVENISFYVPDLDIIVPCNCASHRIKEIETEFEGKSISETREIMKKWLEINGPEKCTGCEPLNVYLAENPECLEKNIFLF